MATISYLRTPDNNQLCMSAQDQQRFAEAVINPPAPNDELKRAQFLHAENVEVQ
jgi:uncharacterized protein (DUF1778 family)